MSDEEREPKVSIPEIDVATGLPAVPEGYFWRIGTAQEYNRVNVSIWVSLRKSAPRWWNQNRTEKIATRSAYAQDTSEKIWIGGYYHYAPATPEQVKKLTLKLAALVYRDNKNSLDDTERRTAQEHALKQIVGDYPPKKLG